MGEEYFQALDQYAVDAYIAGDTDLVNMPSAVDIFRDTFLISAFGGTSQLMHDFGGPDAEKIYYMDGWKLRSKPNPKAQKHSRIQILT